MFDLSTEDNSDEIPVDVISENEPESDEQSKESKPNEMSIEELSKLWELAEQDDVLIQVRRKVNLDLVRRIR